MWGVMWTMVLLAALTNYLAGYLIARHQWSAGNLARLTGISAGFLLGVAIIDLLPEALGDAHDAYHNQRLSWWVLAGFFLVYGSQRWIGGGHLHIHNASQRATTAGTWVGMLIHTFLDGVAIVAAFYIDPNMGLLVGLGVLLHKAADGVTMASVALACGQSKRTALLATASLALATLLGAVSVSAVGRMAHRAFTHGVHHDSMVAVALSLAAGSFIYVAATDLLSILHRENTLRFAPLYVFLGTLAFIILSQALVAIGMNVHLH